MRALLRLLKKINDELARIESKREYKLEPTYYERRQTIEKIYEQQFAKFYYGIRYQYLTCLKNWLKNGLQMAKAA